MSVHVGMSARTVLMTTDAIGGVWTYAIRLARVFAREGVHVALAVLGEPPNAQQRAEAAAIRGLDLRVHPCKLEWMADPWEDVAKSGEFLLNLEQEIRPDVVHLDMFAHGALPFRAPKLLVAHSCVLSWWDAVRKTPLDPMFEPYRAAVARGLAGASMVVAPSHAMLAALTEHYGPLPATAVIYNGAPRPGWVVDEKRSLIVATGRLWDEGKNIGALAAVAKHVRWPIQVIGSATAPDGHVRELPGLHLCGWLGEEDVANALAGAGIYAHPAYYEPFGLSVLEAAHAACALVLGDIPSLREIWGEDAVYVAPDDHDALLWTLNRLIDEPAWRQALGFAARRRARSFTPERTAMAYLALYRELAVEETRVAS